MLVPAPVLHPRFAEICSVDFVLFCWQTNQPTNKQLDMGEKITFLFTLIIQVEMNNDINNNVGQVCL